MSEDFKTNYKKLMEDMKKYKDALTELSSDYRVDKLNIEFEIHETLKTNSN